MTPRRTDEAQSTLPVTHHKIFEHKHGPLRDGFPELGKDPPPFPVEDPRVLDFVRTVTPGPFGDVKVARVYLDGVPLARKLVLHSPTGFEWGYLGSGPADLALNILNLLIKPPEAWRAHQYFKEAFIAPLPEDGGRITLAAIRAWLNDWYQEHPE